jgi:hypothetical protein
MLADQSEESLSGNAMILAWRGWLRVSRTDYEGAITSLREHGVHYLHVMHARDHWLFFGSTKEQDETTMLRLFQRAYPTIH